jgi:outer membrane protein insertion porin family
MTQHSTTQKKKMALRIIRCLAFPALCLPSAITCFAQGYQPYGGQTYPGQTYPAQPYPGQPNGNGGNPVGSPYQPIQNGIVQPVPQGGAYSNVPYGQAPPPQTSYYQPPPQAYNGAPSPYANSGPGVAVPIADQPMPPFNRPQIAAPGPMNEPMGRLNVPWQIDPNTTFMQEPPFGYNPRIRDVPLNVYLQEGQTGRFTIGGAVNSDLGVTGNVTVEERNFDIRAWPNSQRGILNGAFRGDGQNFRLELMPGNRVQRYTVNWTEPNLFGYSPFSLSVGGFYFTRQFREWTEQRLGGRIGVGYEVTEDLSLMTELNLEDVKVFDPAVNTLPALNNVLGSNDMYRGRVHLSHNTRDSPFLPTEGHLLDFIFDQYFGEHDFPRGQINYSKYYLVRERADKTGRHTFSTAFRLGYTGTQTPIFENYFAGGFSTMRGFDFRGIGPFEQGIHTGGRFQFLGSVEYMFPITADDMLKAVAFVDFGTVEKSFKVDWDNFRVAPGLGLRVAVPALGPAPLAFDFAVPVARADTDDRRLFSFSMSGAR